jgi:hypothetical protein
VIGPTSVEEGTTFVFFGPRQVSALFGLRWCVIDATPSHTKQRAITMPRGAASQVLLNPLLRSPRLPMRGGFVRFLPFTLSCAPADNRGLNPTGSAGLSPAHPTSIKAEATSNQSSPLHLFILELSLYHWHSLTYPSSFFASSFLGRCNGQDGGASTKTSAARRFPPCFRSHTPKTCVNNPFCCPGKAGGICKHKSCEGEEQHTHARNAKNNAQSSKAARARAKHTPFLFTQSFATTPPLLNDNNTNHHYT